MIMTIHKSKGLEFPMVLVGGLGKRFNRDSDAYQVSLHKDIGLGIRFVDKENSCYRRTVVQTAIDQKKRREGLAEELRILYVAFTRAMDKLVLLGTVRDIEAAMKNYSIKGSTDFAGAKSYLDFLLPALEQTNIVYRRSNRKDISFRKEETEQKKSEIRRLILGGAPVEAGREDLKSEIQRRLTYEYGHREALRLKSKFTVSELSKLAREQDESLKLGGAVKPVPPLDSPKFTREKSRLTGAERGTILHIVMEQLNFRQTAAKAESVKAVVDDLVKREVLTEEEAATVSYQKIVGFLGSEIGRRACRAEKLYKEVSFNIMREMSGEKIIVQGTIDCYFEEDGKYILLDYKSNYVGDPGDESAIERLTEGYRTQLELYREALERIRGVKVEEAYLYLFQIEKGIRVL
jgi:ATP-dependent helicase/nuclease subunit A